MVSFILCRIAGLVLLTYHWPWSIQYPTQKVLWRIYNGIANWKYRNVDLTDDYPF